MGGKWTTSLTMGEDTIKELLKMKNFNNKNKNKNIFNKISSISANLY